MTLYFSPDSPMNQQKTPNSSTEEVFVLPTSFAQQRLWFVDQLQAGISFYNLSKVLRLNGKVNVAALQQSFNEIVHRHEVLRTTFLTVEGQPMQVITPQLTFTLPIVDLQTLPIAQQQAEVKRLASQEVQHPFSLAQGPLLRTKLLQLSSQKYVFILTMHHIVSDGWSMDVLIRELTTLYQAFCNGNASPIPPLPIQYADFAVWQRQWLQDEVLESQLSYWKQQLNGAPPMLQLPSDRPRPPVQSFRGATKLFALPPHLSQALKNLSRQEGVTLFMTLLTAFKVLLYRYTGQEDIIVGSPIAGRNRKELEGLIGFFINNLVLRTDLSGHPSFRELLQRVREVTLGAYAHQDLPFEKLVEELQPSRDLSYNPLFQVAFVLQNTPMTTIKLSGVTIHPLEVEDINTVQFDLVLSIQETEQGLAGALMYNTDLFDAATITWMLRHLQTLLEDIVAHPTKHIFHLSLLDESEQKQLLMKWNNTQVDYPFVCIHQLFEAQVERTPDAVAIVFENQQLTYQQLNAHANQVAYLLQALGVGPEVLVGICLDRSLEMVIGLLGILKAGGAYLPIDPSYPQQRKAFILSDSQATVLLTQQQLTTSLEQYEAQVVCIDRDWQNIAAHNQNNLGSGVQPDNYAYIIYTSGSTGQPKGVQITHRSVVNFLTAMQQQPGLTDRDTLLAVTTLSFDIAVLEIFLPLVVGARVVLLSWQVATDGVQLSQQISNWGVTVMQATPATWRMLLEAGWEGSPQLKILCTGEALQRQLAVKLQHRGASMWNLYGPTETTIESTIYQVDKREESIPIGRPISNTYIYILDRHLQPVPMGVPGEIYIGGAGLARGYLNRPELTAEKFIPNPFSERSELLYKTGDLGRYLSDGYIEYKGRIDYQIKLRGFRIELGEIEILLNQHPAVQETAVIVREDIPGNQRLVAYTVLYGEFDTGLTAELRQFLKQKLPEYMVPSLFMMVKTMPLTPNGKIDRKALPVPNLAQSELKGTYSAPHTKTEEILAKLYAQVLGVEKIGVNDDFFEIGGHSLLATQLISRLRKIFHVELPLRYLFEAPTIASLSKRIEAANYENQSQQLLSIKLAPRNEKLPLSFAQQRLWFLDQLEEKNSKYNISAALRLSGSLYIKSLEQSLNEIIKRHEVLRTTFTTVDDEPIQVINPTSTLTLSRVDLCDLAKTEQDVVVTQLAIEEAKRPFNLSIGPLLRTTLLQLDSTKYVLLLTMHHIVSDGWSIGVFIREIMTFYKAFCTGKPSPLPELVIQYADFALWQRQWLQGDILEAQLSYWKQQLGNNLSILQLPTDYPRPAVQTFQGTTQSFALSKALSDSLRSLSRQEGVTLFMTLLAAFKILLYWYTTQDDIIVGTDVANRNQVETEDLIGFFVNQLVLRTNLSGNPTYFELLKRVREVTLQAYAHQDLPFEKLVEVLKPERDLSRNPLFQVMFSFLNTPMPDLDLLGLTISSLKIDSGTTVFDLSLYIIDTEQELIGVLRYNTDLFHSTRMTRLIKHFETLLHAVIAKPDTRINTLQKILVEADSQYRRAKQQEFKETRSKKLKSIKPKPIHG